VSEPSGGIPLDFDESIFTRAETAENVSDLRQNFTTNQQLTVEKCQRQAIESIEEPAVTELDGPDGLHLTAMGNAERFLRDYGKDVLWVEGPQRTSTTML